MSLLNEFITEGLIDADALEMLNGANVSSDWEKLRFLAKQGWIAEESILHALSLRYHLPLLSDFPDMIPEPLAFEIFEKTRIMILVIDQKACGLLSLHSDWFQMDYARFRWGRPVEWVLCPEARINRPLKGSESPEQADQISAAEQFQKILKQTVELGGSDIHLEPSNQGLKVRIRVDGHLRELTRLPLYLQSLVLSHVKIRSGMDIAIRRKPQDGHHSYHASNGKTFDIRVSSLPTETGEKIVLRLLDQTPVQYQLESLGFMKEDLGVLSQGCQLNSGLLLVVGPTGSGKTTTLYAMLHEIHSVTRNIITIEDPVEYHIDGMNQVSVKQDPNVSFASVLRASLRQDPDVILVGEIRDEETAQVAVKAALTGHLVLSTLHSVDCATTIQRLLNLGVSTDLLAETVKLVISQRLVRRACTHPETETNCSLCHGSGYHGRTPIYEILRIDTPMQEKIRQGISGHALFTGDGFYYQSFRSTALELIRRQITTDEELRPFLTE
ncbi:MAG: Flp pilus assembly complex ATPase component TadA [SAR324 cluster bacterium]|nr:Flp pilus assembly complex ATPase component TadA [SAR324 cluster bacterium]